MRWQSSSFSSWYIKRLQYRNFTALWMSHHSRSRTVLLTRASDYNCNTGVYSRLANRLIHLCSDHNFWDSFWRHSDETKENVQIYANGTALRWERWQPKRGNPTPRYKRKRSQQWATKASRQWCILRLPFTRSAGNWHFATPTILSISSRWLGLRHIMLWYHDVNQILSLPTGIYPHGADKRFAEGWAKSLLVYWDCGNDNWICCVDCRFVFDSRDVDFHGSCSIIAAKL